MYWRITIIVENARREFADGPLSTVIADAHPFPSLVRSAPKTDIPWPAPNWPSVDQKPEFEGEE